MKTDSPSKTKGQLTEGSVVGHLVKLTVPLIWGVFAVIAFNLVETPKNAIDYRDRN
ncbi:MAG: hypothetical protein EBE86_005200 [Hormoscilla sp. GUM202]|nr:hypothetical protein [Hormoscilla sp. SP12CHS1]MBO1346820.1 hypothetical protein [Hormoscilla sp. GUM202]